MYVVGPWSSLSLGQEQPINTQSLGSAAFRRCSAQARLYARYCRDQPCLLIYLTDEQNSPPLTQIMTCATCMYPADSGRGTQAEPANIF